MPDTSFEQMLRDRLSQMVGGSPAVAAARALAPPTAPPVAPMVQAPTPPLPKRTLTDINLPKDPTLLEGSSPEVIQANIDMLTKNGTPEPVAIRLARAKAGTPKL